MLNFLKFRTAHVNYRHDELVMQLAFICIPALPQDLIPFGPAKGSHPHRLNPLKLLLLGLNLHFIKP